MVCWGNHLMTYSTNHTPQTVGLLAVWLDKKYILMTALCMHIYAFSRTKTQLKMPTSLIIIYMTIIWLYYMTVDFDMSHVMMTHH